MIDIVVWGEYACFTRAEFKVERVSYAVITPSAARGLLEAIYWKPQMRYRIQEIGVIKLGSQTSILRNELSERQRPPATNKGGGLMVEEKRQQRSSLVLRDVCYRIKAWIDVLPGSPHGAAKHLACFNRRVQRGECFHHPYLGCREFTANFEPATREHQPDASLNMALGTMLFDIAYTKVSGERADLAFYRHDEGRNANERRAVPGATRSLMFAAKLENGWIRLPQEKYRDLDQLEGRRWDS